VSVFYVVRVRGEVNPAKPLVGVLWGCEDFEDLLSMIDAGTCVNDCEFAMYERSVGGGFLCTTYGEGDMAEESWSPVGGSELALGACDDDSTWYLIDGYSLDKALGMEDAFHPEFVPAIGVRDMLTAEGEISKRELNKIKREMVKAIIDSIGDKLAVVVDAVNLITDTPDKHHDAPF